MSDLPDGFQTIIRDVIAELTRAESLHPNWPSDPIHAVAVLVEEVGELTQKCLQATHEPRKGVTIDEVREEAVQAAAMGLRFLVNFHRYQFPAAARRHMCGRKPLDGAPGQPCPRILGHTGPCAH